MSQALAQDLPQELLGEIFVWCIPRDALQPNSRLAPLVLCQVCSSWRKAALGTPHLWNALSMELERASVRSVGGGLLRAKLNALEFWGSHMGALLSSLHFRRGHSRAFISYQDRHKLVTFQTFFRSPVMSNVQSLTLDGFSEIDILKFSFLVNTPFNNLEYLSIFGKSPQPFQFPACPALRRLQIGFRVAGLQNGFPWVTLTHLKADLKLGRKDWYTILAQCVNMTSCSLILSFLWEAPNDQPPTLRHNLRKASVKAFSGEFISIFSDFVFPSLVALRLSCMDALTTLRDVHQVINAAPALKEFHMQVCVPFGSTHFLQQPAQDLQFAGPLHKFAPGLVTLVIDRITTTRDALTVLHSNWLNGDWATLSHTRLSVEVIFDAMGPSLVDDVNREINRCGYLPFHASARCVPGGLWDISDLTARDLRDRWDDLLGFTL